MIIIFVLSQHRHSQVGYPPPPPHHHHHHHHHHHSLRPCCVLLSCACISTKSSLREGEATSTQTNQEKQRKGENTKKKKNEEQYRNRIISLLLVPFSLIASHISLFGSLSLSGPFFFGLWFHLSTFSLCVLSIQICFPGRADLLWKGSTDDSLSRRRVEEDVEARHKSVFSSSPPSSHFLCAIHTL